MREGAIKTMKSMHGIAQVSKGEMRCLELLQQRLVFLLHVQLVSARVSLLRSDVSFSFFSVPYPPPFLVSYYMFSDSWTISGLPGAFTLPSSFLLFLEYLLRIPSLLLPLFHL